AYLLYEWRWKDGFEALQKAKQVNPGSTAANELLSFYYILMGEKILAIKIMEEAVQRDPLSAIMSQALGNTYLFAGRFEDALRQADKILEINPTMRSTLEMKGWATGMKGDWESALLIFEEVHRLTGHPLKGLMGLGFAYAKLGYRDKAMDCIQKLEQRQLEDPNTVIDADLVTIWFALGDIDKVIYYVKECMNKRMAPINYFVEYPLFSSLRTDTRYIELMKLMVEG
ncbi:MAG: hypothetical protein ABJA70_15930, partial [Chryseolinea sp.]